MQHHPSPRRPVRSAFANGAAALAATTKAAGTALRRSWATQVELHERWLLLDPSGAGASTGAREQRDAGRAAGPRW